MPARPYPPRGPGRLLASPIAGRYLLAATLVGAGLLFSVLTFEQQETGVLARLVASSADGDAMAGVVRPASESTVSADGPLRIDDVLVEPGETVRAGQALFVVEDREARMALPAARLEVEDSLVELRTLELEAGPIGRETRALTRRVTGLSAELDVASRAAAAVPNPQIRTSLPRAQAAYDLAVLRLQRARQLHADRVAPAQELEDAEIAMRVAADDLDVARRADAVHDDAASAESARAGLRSRVTALEDERERRGHTVALARARLRHERARSRLTALEERVARSRIDAPAAGTLADVRVSRGDLVTPGTVLARLADVDRLVVEVQVASEVVPRLRLGGPAVVTVNGTSDIQQPGIVRSIEPTPGANGTHQVVVGFTPPPGVILSGQAATVSLPATR